MTIEKFKTGNYRTKVTPEQSKEIQELCFEHGTRWHTDNCVKYTDVKYLYFDGGLIGYDRTKRYFKANENKKVSAEYLLYVLRGEHYITTADKAACVAHYTRMITWVKTQAGEHRADCDYMDRIIGENWQAMHCALCKKYVHKVCVECPLNESGQFCPDDGSLWNKMNASDTWAEWLKYAKKLRKYLNALPEAVEKKAEPKQPTFGIKGSCADVEFELINSFGGLAIKMVGNESGNICKIERNGTLGMYTSIGGVPGLQLDGEGRIKVSG